MKRLLIPLLLLVCGCRCHHTFIRVNPLKKGQPTKIYVQHNDELVWRTEIQCPEESK